MINHKYKFVFAHIPKTGGMSVESALKGFGSEYVHRHGPKTEQHPHLCKHASLLTIKNNLKDFEGYFKFAFIRNPWEWVASNYVFNHGRHFPYLEKLKYTKYRLFKFHLNKEKKKRGEKLLKEEKDIFLFWLDWWTKGCKPSQHELICDEKNKELTDFLGNFDDFTNDFNLITKKIGIENAVLPHRNKSKKYNYRELYNDESIELVNSYFKKDISYFNYKF
jgi:hypothetical protein